MGLLKRVGSIIDKGVDIADQAVVDKDKLNELKYTLEKARAELLLGGKGQSVTKITICALVSLVVGVLSWTFMLHPENMQNAINYAQAVTPIIGILIGVYGAGTSFKRSKWSRDE
jgi:hypothetical protein